MRVWDKAVYWLRCGRCSAEIVKGEPFQVIQFEGVARQLVRCVACADGPAPTDFAGMDKRETRGPVMLRLGDIGHDFKTAQYEARDPGEEG